MKNILLLSYFISFAFSNLIQAQNTQRIDSLLSIYNDTKSPDTLKVKVLNLVFHAYIYYDQEKAEQYLSKAYSMAKKMGDEDALARTMGNKGIFFDVIDEIDSAKFYNKKAIALFEKTNNTDKLEMVRFNLAMIEQKEGNYQQAIELVKQNIESHSRVTNENALSLAISYGLLSRVYRTKGYYRLSLESALDALNAVEITEDELRIADALRDLASIESTLLHFQKSNEYLHQSIALYEKYDDKFYLAGSKNDLGSNYIQLQEYPKAIKVLGEGLDLAREVGSTEAEVVTLINLGQAYIEQAEFERALKYLLEARKVCENNNQTNHLLEVNFYLGNLYLEWKRYAKALPFFNKSIVQAESTEKREFLEEVYLQRAKTLKATGNYKSSIEDYNKSYEISITNYDTRQVATIEELRIIHDTEQKEKEITLLAKNAELERLKATRLWISLVAIFGLASILLWSQWQKRRKERLLYQKEQEVEAEKRKVAELENHKLNRELDFKKQELTSKVLQLCRKNEFLQSLNQEVKKFKGEFKGVDKTRLEKLSRKINRDMDADADWAQFLKSFESIHPDFKRLLLQKHPTLAPNEIRLAYLMRMNLESKDIANLLNITPDSVKKARYRMRKKMGQESSVNLTEYFMNLGLTERLDNRP